MKMILNLFIYIWVFKDKENIERLSKSVWIANTIYILSIFIAILTRTSSNTYIEGMGYKGWFESGNSLSSILILSLFMIIKYSKDNLFIVRTFSAKAKTLGFVFGTLSMLITLAILFLNISHFNLSNI